MTVPPTTAMSSPSRIPPIPPISKRMPAAMARPVRLPAAAAAAGAAQATAGWAIAGWGIAGGGTGGGVYAGGV